MTFNIKYNIVQGEVLALIHTKGINEETSMLCGLIVMPLEQFKAFRADFERGADFDPANRNSVMFIPDSSIRAAWSTT